MASLRKIIIYEFIRTVLLFFVTCTYFGTSIYNFLILGSMILFSVAQTIERYQKQVKEIGINHKGDANSQVNQTFFHFIVWLKLVVLIHILGFTNCG